MLRIATRHQFAGMKHIAFPSMKVRKYLYFVGKMMMRKRNDFSSPLRGSNTSTYSFQI